MSEIKQENNNIKLSLDPENSVLSNIPVRESIVDRSEESDFSAGTIDESMLTDEEKKIVDQFVEEIDVMNVDKMVNYGASAQKNISSFSISVLNQVKTLDLGEVGEALKDLTVALDATVEPEKKGFARLIQRIKRGASSVRANYAKAESNVDRIEDDLKKHQSVLATDISMYQQMFDLNMQYYKELTMYIIAGKKALDIARKSKLQELKNKADESKKQEDAQEYRDFYDQCNRFEKRVSDLEITRMIAIQVAPQVRALQNNDREMLDKIQSSISNTIPLWRNQLVMSLGLEHTKRAIEAQTTLSDKTNELLAKNAEMLKISSIAAAKESERPIVEMSTLRQCNKDLITSINEVIRIHEQGADKRRQTHDELVQIENELKQALLESGNR